MMVACTTQQSVVDAASSVLQDRVDAPVPPSFTGSNAKMLPRQIVYKMTKDYSALVPVMMDSQRRQIVSYPDPADLSEDSMPISLGNGWWLDRRGIAKSTVFTTYTYSEYMKMKTAPSMAELTSHLIVDEESIVELISLDNSKSFSIDELKVMATNDFK